MPTYTYRCPQCGHSYEKLQKITDDTRAKCPECGTRGERVITGGAGLLFKGSGFYVTDYKRAGADASGEGETKKSKKTDKKTPERAPESAPPGKNTGTDS